MSEKDESAPEGFLREDGCICPEPPPPPPEVVPECPERPLSTCPYDPRFPHQNQTKRCYLSFIDYQRCARLLGDYPGCLYFYRCYKALCPSAWQERWFDQMEQGTFPRKIYPPKPIIKTELNTSFCAEPGDDIDDEMPPPDIC